MSRVGALLGLRRRFLVSPMQDVLEAKGFAVTTVWTTDSLLHHLSDAPCQLVVLDSHLPGRINATEVLDHAYRNAETVAFVLVTPTLPEMRYYAPYPNVRGCISAPGQLDDLIAVLVAAAAGEPTRTLAMGPR